MRQAFLRAQAAQTAASFFLLTPVPAQTVSKSGVEQEGYTPPAHLWEELDKGLIRLLEASKAKVRVGGFVGRAGQGV